MTELVDMFGLVHCNCPVGKCLYDRPANDKPGCKDRVCAHPDSKKPEYVFNKDKRGAVDPTLDGKTRITLHLDTSVINWFRHTSVNDTPIMVNERINEVLRLRMYREILALDEKKLKGKIMKFITRCVKRGDQNSLFNDDERASIKTYFHRCVAYRGHLVYWMKEG